MWHISGTEQPELRISYTNLANIFFNGIQQYHWYTDRGEVSYKSKKKISWRYDRNYEWESGFTERWKVSSPTKADIGRWWQAMLVDNDFFFLSWWYEGWWSSGRWKDEPVMVDCCWGDLTARTRGAAKRAARRTAKQTVRQLMEGVLRRVLQQTPRARSRNG